MSRPAFHHTPKTIARIRASMADRSREYRSSLFDHVFAVLRLHVDGLSLRYIRRAIGDVSEGAVSDVVHCLAAEGLLLTRFTHPVIYRLPPIAHHGGSR